MPTMDVNAGVFNLCLCALCVLAVGTEGDVTIGPLVVADRAMFLSKAGTFPSFTIEQGSSDFFCSGVNC